MPARVHTLLAKHHCVDILMKYLDAWGKLLKKLYFTMI